MPPRKRATARQTPAQPRRAPVVAPTPEPVAAPPATGSGPDGGAAAETTPEVAAPPVPPVTKVTIDKPRPVRAGGHVLTKRGWVIDDGRWD